MSGRYRMRTWLRVNAPLPLANRVPKGRDCGQKEWYSSLHKDWHWYHFKGIRVWEVPKGRGCVQHEWYDSLHKVWHCHRCKVILVGDDPEELASAVQIPS